MPQESSPADPPPDRRWPAALLGVWLVVFGVLALTGPGRIDIIDGQIRYAVAESLYEHGDSVVRDPDVKFHIYPGRDGQRYTPYRLPQSVFGVGAIWLADRLGPSDDARRHFLFVLTSAAAAGLVAVGLADWFLRSGLSARAAMWWAVAGVFCTPVWYYGTSTFDDILGVAGVVLGLAMARRARDGAGWGWAIGVALAMAWMVNCKPPLGLFLIAFLGAADNPARVWWHRLGVVGVIGAGAAAGVVVYKWYELYKFPPGTDWLPAFAADFGPIWTPNPVPGLCSFLLSPGAGVIWYCPPFVLACVGIWYGSGDRTTRWAIALGAAAFAWSVCHLTFFKGTLGWGPRYFTPVFAVTWVFAPAGVALLSRRLVAAVLASGLVVQILALTVDPFRMHMTQIMPDNYYLTDPWTEFNPHYSDLPQRPNQIAGILRAAPREEFSPAKVPTHALGSFYWSEAQSLMDRYYVWNGFRPWPIAYRHLAPARWPVPYWGTIAALGMVAGVGVGLMGWASPSRFGD